MPMPEHPWPDGVEPQSGREVLVTLQDGSTVLAMRVQGKWVVGVDNNPEEADLQGAVKSWKLREAEEG